MKKYSIKDISWFLTRFRVKSIRLFSVDSKESPLLQFPSSIVGDIPRNSTCLWV